MQQSAKTSSVRYILTFRKESICHGFVEQQTAGNQAQWRLLYLHFKDEGRGSLQSRLNPFSTRPRVKKLEELEEGEGREAAFVLARDNV